MEAPNFEQYSNVFLMGVNKVLVLVKVDEAKTWYKRQVLAVKVAEKPTMQSTAGKMLLTVNKARLILKFQTVTTNLLF